MRQMPPSGASLSSRCRGPPVSLATLFGRRDRLRDALAGLTRSCTYASQAEGGAFASP